MKTFTFQGQLYTYQYYPGEGTPVVLLHGFLEQQAMWAAFRQMALPHRAVLVLDLPGHGQAPLLSATHTMEQLADLVNALLELLQFPRVVLHGHSMGGYVALAFAEKHPQKLAGLILQNSSPFADSKERQQQRDRAIYLAQQHRAVYIKNTIPQLFNSPQSPALKKAIAEAVKQGLNTSTAGITASLQGMKLRPDRTQILLQLKCPILMVAGQNDPLIPLQSLEPLQKTKSLKLTSVKGGHMSHLEDTKGLMAAVHTFLRHLP